MGEGMLNGGVVSDLGGGNRQGKDTEEKKERDGRKEEAWHMNKNCYEIFGLLITDKFGRFV
jgi:hypothetical protein